MDIPDELFYTLDHEWVKANGGFAEVGITDYAQSELGDIVFIEFPRIGDIYEKGDVFGTIEAVKTVADLYMPISGKVTEINNLLESEPENINNKPYSKGWIIKVEISKADELSKLLSSKDYRETV